MKAMSLPPPNGGWNTRDSAAVMKPQFAQILDNWIPRPSRLELRGGSEVWATGFSNPVQTIMAYRRASGSSKLFAATASGIYDITASGAVGAPATAITDGQVQFTNCATSAGQFLFCVNGTDSARYYDNASWTTVATYVLGGGTIATTNFISVHFHRFRQFFVPKNELAFYYNTSAGAITGTVARFPCDQLFSKGGYLMAVTSWSIDAGAGMEDHFVAISSEGQAAIFLGADPGDASNWSLKGIYDVGRPLGRRCFLKYGGDVLLLADSGIYPLSRAAQTAAIDRRIAISDTIGPTFQELGHIHQADFGWQLCLFSSQALLLCLVPSSPRCILGMDTTGRGWARFTNWHFFCCETFGDALFAGGLAGPSGARVVAKLFTGSVDWAGASTDADVTATYLTAPHTFSGRGIQKLPQLVRPVYKATGTFAQTLGASVDYSEKYHEYYIPGATAGMALWDTSHWDTPGEAWAEGNYTLAEWRTLAAYPGASLALFLQVVSPTGKVSLHAVDWAIDTGGVL